MSHAETWVPARAVWKSVLPNSVAFSRCNPSNVTSGVKSKHDISQDGRHHIAARCQSPRSVCQKFNIQVGRALSELAKNEIGLCPKNSRNHVLIPAVSFCVLDSKFACLKDFTRFCFFGLSRTHHRWRMWKTRITTRRYSG